MMDCFIPLGGGDEVGASAYFLSIDGTNILLDCGARLKGEELYPDYERLLRELPDFADVDLILISHGHYDHIGSFARIAALAPNAEIITTNDTKRLISMQLLDFGRISGRSESERVRDERYRLAQGMMARIQVRPVLRTFERKGCRITFLPAGHMMGAVMIFLESRNHRILYSGDFSVHTMFGTNGMKLPPDLSPGVLLLNAPNAYLDAKEWSAQLSGTGESRYEADHYKRLETTIRRNLRERKKVYLISRSIPKHLDLFWFLKHVFPEVPVLLEPKSRAIADSLADMGYDVYWNSVHTGENLDTPSEQGCIFVGQETGRQGCVSIFCDGYSLHASPAETCRFVKEVNAPQVFLLHVKPDGGKTSLGDVLAEEDGALTVTQAENGRKYYLKREREMKHVQLFEEVMHRELATAKEQLSDSQRMKAKASMEWAAIYGSLMYPELHPRVAYQQIQKTFVGKYSITYEDYIDALKSVNLDSEEKRKYVMSLVEQGISLMKKALDGDTAAMQQYAEFTEDLEPRDWKNRKMFFVGKCMVAFMILMDPDLKNDSYRPIVVSFGARYCDRLLRTIRDRLFGEYGMRRRRKTARDVLQKTEKALTESSEAAAGFASGDELEQLRFMNNNYKNSLELVQAMLDELNETIDESAADARNAAIASFYTTMNSDEYGNLLDSLELVDRRLAALKEQKVKIPPQLLPLTIVFKQLLRFIRECGVTPIDTTGREFEAEAEGLADYTYIGEEYTRPGETKTVVVERPGWKFGTTVISLPTVREKEEERE